MIFNILKAVRFYMQVDAIVSSVNRMGVFADVGPLPVFVSNQVCSTTVQYNKRRTEDTTNTI